jgi:hypothetical protein
MKQVHHLRYSQREWFDVNLMYHVMQIFKMLTISSDPPFGESKQTLNACFIGSASRHPTIL